MRKGNEGISLEENIFNSSIRINTESGFYCSCKTLYLGYDIVLSSSVV